MKNNAIKEDAGEEEEEGRRRRRRSIESELEREMKRIKEELFLLGYRDEAEVENVREKMEARSRSPVDILDGSSLTDVEPARCLDHMGCLPLHYAVQRRTKIARLNTENREAIAIVDKLLERFPAGASQLDVNGRAPLPSSHCRCAP